MRLRLRLRLADDIYTHIQDSTYVFDDLEEREIFLGPEGIFLEIYNGMIGVSSTCCITSSAFRGF